MVAKTRAIGCGNIPEKKMGMMMLMTMLILMATMMINLYFVFSMCNHCAKGLMCIISFNLHIKSIRDTCPVLQMWKLKD